MVVFCAFHPGLAYFHPAVQKRPVGRGATDDSFTHFVPTEFATAARDSLLLDAVRAGALALSVKRSAPAGNSSVMIAQSSVTTGTLLASPIH